MLLSLSWLREFVPYEGTAQELGDKLTMLGLELEDIVRPYEAISSIVVGHVVECADHPESDHLHICKVDAGQGELLDIVCGAPNVAKGQKVPVALVGTTMPGGLVIKKAKLRGAPSHGMICSERELGLTEDHSGIMVLPDSAVPGARLVDTLELDREVLDISITPNRADCLSVLGLARETALAFKLPLTIPELPLEENGPALALPDVDIADGDACPLYAGRVIADVKIGPSPIRIRHRLHAVGVRPISNIVDVTNYILFEFGQPLHSFDLDKLQGGCIRVDFAAEGERLVTLDGQDLLQARAHPQDVPPPRPVVRILLPLRARHRSVPHPLGHGSRRGHDGQPFRRQGLPRQEPRRTPSLCSRPHHLPSRTRQRASGCGAFPRVRRGSAGRYGLRP